VAVVGKLDLPGASLVVVAVVTKAATAPDAPAEEAAVCATAGRLAVLAERTSACALQLRGREGGGEEKKGSSACTASAKQRVRVCGNVGDRDTL
jgi:hypothetical protein